MLKKFMFLAGVGLMSVAFMGCEPQTGTSATDDVTTTDAVIVESDGTTEDAVVVEQDTESP